MTDLDELRSRLRELDTELADLAARRLEVVREIGDRKREQNLPIRDYGVEREAIDTVRSACRERGVSPDLGEKLVQHLIKEALRVQEAEAHARSQIADGHRAVVAGGAGAMGRWFAGFLQDAGYSITVVDPSGPVDGVDHSTDLASAAADASLVVVSTPPSTVDDVLATLEDATDALVFDIASLKGPFRPRLRSMAEAGQPVASIHPMWGPDTEILADKNLLVCDCGHPGAAAEVRALFDHTAVNLLDVPLDAHDGFMAYTLGLPHALNIVFGDVLRRGPHDFPELADRGGPTFTNQVAIASDLARENKDLYYEIQTLNQHTSAIYGALRAALDGLEDDLVHRDDFVDRMEAVRRWFDTDPDTKEGTPSR